MLDNIYLSVEANVNKAFQSSDICSLFLLFLNINIFGVL